MAFLGVNVDHVATLREARGTYEPDPVWAAVEAQLGGADLITIHLREDRRHICDRDLRLMMQTVSVPLNLEMSLQEEIVAVALEVHPPMITVVPERREELTTEGGLDVQSEVERISEIVDRFKDNGAKVSLFIDPEIGQINACSETGADMIELHTGPYAGSSGEKRALEIDKLTRGAAHGRKQELTVNAGHGLTYNNVPGIVETIKPRELHIGHSIIARSVFTGIRGAVEEMKNVIQKTLLMGG